jgi:hypothetical protein
MIKIQITYEKTTPESAEQGDVADHGFAEPGGYEYSIADQAFEERVRPGGREQALKDARPEPEEFSTINDAVSFLQDNGPLEPSSSVPDEHTWLSQIDPSLDYATGEETRLSFHLETDDPAVHVLILWLLAGKKGTEPVAYHECEECEAIIPASNPAIYHDDLCSLHESEGDPV